MKTLLSACVAAALSAAPATAQIVISEINLTAQSGSDDQWIELVNLGTSKVDLSSWSLYLSTSTTSNYWWAFLPSTEIQSGAFLRVHWFVPVKPSTTTDYYTGDDVLHFLFGYGGVALPKAGGALALFNTQLNLKMNDPSIVEDWVTWGGSGYKRESLAITNGKWTASASVAAPVEKDSIALIYAQQAEPTPASAFFHDMTPTPLLNNTGAANVSSYGSSCSSGSINGPGLEALSVPALGNRDFGFRLTNTLALPNFGVIALSTGSADIPVGFCKLLVNPAVLVLTGALPTQAGSTVFPLPLPNGLFGSLYAQGLVFPQPLTFFDFGLSQGLKLDMGQ